jgi:RHS repeat-associated protein
MSQAVKGSTTATYGYDGLGQRVKKTGPTSVVPTGTNYFVYNEQGQLLGEYNSSGAVIQEYVWLGTMPIAVLRGSTGSPQIFYVYADQIDRPWVITNTANQIRWRWDTTPFGELPANDNPAGLGAFAFNQRFAGQYRDAETGLFYNYYRDYDPQTGRYVQSDPIGLAGGVNPYLYVGGKPLSFIDALGLETTIVTTYDKAYGVEYGSHSALHVATPGQPQFLYDPAGSYQPGGVPRPEAGFFEGRSAHLDSYVRFHQSTGSRVELTRLNTTPAQEAAIKARAIEIGDPRGFSCARSVSDALRGVCGIGGSGFPGRLNRQGQEAQCRP